MQFQIGQPVSVKKSKRTYVHTPQGSWGYVTEINEAAQQATIDFHHIARKGKRRFENDRQVSRVYLNDIAPYESPETKAALARAKERMEAVDKIAGPRTEDAKPQKQEAAIEDLTGKTIDKLVLKDGIVQHIRQKVIQALPLSDFIKKVIPSKQYQITTPLLPPSTAFYFQNHSKSKQIYVTENSPGAYDLTIFLEDQTEPQQSTLSLPWLYFVWYFQQNELIDLQAYVCYDMITEDTNTLFELPFDITMLTSNCEKKPSRVETIESNFKRFFEVPLRLKNGNEATLNEWKQKTEQDDLFILNTDDANRRACECTIESLASDFIG